MKLAWIRTDTPSTTNTLDDSAALVAAIGETHDIEAFTLSTAHDFLQRHAHHPFDLLVLDIDRTPLHEGLLAVLLRDSGVVRLRTLARADVGTLVSAARVTIVHSAATADDLRAWYPSSRVQVAAVGVPGKVMPDTQPKEPAAVVFGSFTPTRTGLIRRALDRAGLGGDSAVLPSDLAPEEILARADVVVSVRWPWTGEPEIEALAGLAAGKPVVVLDTQGTADWPALNPQTWQPRGPTPAAPIVVSVDPLDEEHSLALAFGRLSTDPALRLSLGTAARDWWLGHATPQHAAVDWDRILHEAASPVTPASRAR